MKAPAIVFCLLGSALVLGGCARAYPALSCVVASENELGELSPEAAARIIDALDTILSERGFTNDVGNPPVIVYENADISTTVNLIRHVPNAGAVISLHVLSDAPNAELVPDLARALEVGLPPEMILRECDEVYEGLAPVIIR